MFKLKKLVIDKFLSILHAEIDFSKPGLYLITGYNDLGGDSNGCGKSTILAAIAYALWGKTPSGLKGSEVANWDADGSYAVVLYLEGPEGEYRIDRNYLDLVLSINGKVQQGRKTDVQDLITRTFHSSYEVFFSSSLFTSDMSDYLTKMGDAGKKKLLKTIIGLDKIDKAYIKAKASYDENTLKAETLEQKLKLLQEFVTTRKRELASLEDEYSEYENERQLKLSALKSQTLTNPVEDPSLVFRTRAAEVALEKATGDIPRIQTSIDNNEVTFRKYYEQIGKLEQTITDLEFKLSEANSLQGKVECDKCGSLLRDDFQTRISKIQQTLDAAKTSHFQINQAIQKLEQEQITLNSYFGRLEQLRASVEEHTALLVAQEDALRKCKEFNDDLSAKINEVTNTPNPYEGLYMSLEQSYQLTLSDISTVSADFKSTTAKIDILAFMKLLFSREGVAAQIIETAFSRLETLANRYLTKICSEGLVIHIVPQRELKSKALREEIDIYITSRHRPQLKIAFGALSGGQQQRVNIALLIALFKFCRDLGSNQFDFLILDEVLDLSLGAKGQSDVVGLLRDLLMEVSHIIVVSHKEGISHDFDHEIQVRRGTDQVSRIV